jgi:restriction system protein
MASNNPMKLNESISSGGRGAFITIAELQGAANEIALEKGFPRIGLVNGWKLVNLLIEHWSDMSEDFKNKLGLKLGLVRV